ncbi:unnamed protein product [Penicillium olsonii]|uniref:non-specific serine/threonine protein kinase n=1 Tax=Penicillium olsonii TaxID=99116 RepID=A0A9W4I1F6_PENOL|nr:unnamed protein product [Penicillium olsonii]CAG8201747.1 unnamed protein product [Penicillium olsonii]
MKERRLLGFRAVFPTPSFPYSTTTHSAFRRILPIKRDMAHLRSPSKPRVFPSSGWDIIDPCIPIEEESIPTYRPEKFCPVYIGEVFNHRYQVLGKLGYGSTATVWLGRDLFDYTCLVHPPLGISLDQLTQLLPGGVMSSAMVRTTIRNVLAALDFLHTEAHVIRTDLQPNNILLGIKDNSVLSKFEQAEVDMPVPRKTLENRTTYFSRPLSVSYGTPVLCDLGEARLGTNNQKGDIMPDIYRAPEVI